jgi:LuxR family maltose regulon positive regulatory protein
LRDHSRTADSGRPVPLRLIRARGFVPSERLLQPPQPRPGIVVRGPLVDLLRESADVPVVLVSGPPGSGKTTLLAQCAGEDTRPFAWLTLDESMNDPTILVTYVMLALQRLVNADPGVLGALAEQSAVPTVLLPRLGRMLANLRSPFVLVVDNAEVLHAPDAVAVLATMVDHLNPGSQLAIAARTPPDLPWTQLRAQRRLVSVGPDDLRLTPAEAGAVLAAVGADLTPDEVATLLRRTEGWAAGIYLAAVSCSASERRRQTLAAFGAADSVLGAYLRDELLAGQPEDIRQFLVASSILDRLSGPLCDAVLHRRGSDRVLQQLAESHLFVVPLDPAGCWYRYHHLFHDMLREELSGWRPRDVAALHARASAWLADAGDVPAAIPHAQAAGAIDRAAALVWSQVGECVATGQLGTVEAWLEGFTADQLTRHRLLALAAAWCAMEAGRPVDHWIAAAEHGAGDAEADVEFTASLALLHAQRARSGVAQMRADAERAAQLLSPGDPWSAVAEYLAGVAVLFSDDDAAGRAQIDRAGLVAEAIDTPYIRAQCVAQLAALAVEAGDWTSTTALTDEAVALLAAGDVLETPSAIIVHCVSALLQAKQGQAQPARQLARRTMALTTVLDQSQPWLAAQARYLLARVFLLLGDPSAARVLLSEAQTQLHPLPDARWLRARLDDAWTHAESFPLSTGVGPSALTSAELRVLQLLPTHLSFEEIGKQLSVSRNTVKTQAIAAYRKLGVSSRTEAVERATSLGMIQS